MASVQHRTQARFLAWLIGSDIDERRILPPALIWTRNKQNKLVLCFFTTSNTHKHVVPVGCLQPRGGPCPHCKCYNKLLWKWELQTLAVSSRDLSMLTTLLFSSDLLQQEHHGVIANSDEARTLQRTVSIWVRLCELCRPSISLLLQPPGLQELWFSRLSQIFPWHLKATGKQVLPMDCASIELKYSHEKFHLMLSGSLWSL